MTTPIRRILARPGLSYTANDADGPRFPERSVDDVRVGCRSRPVEVMTFDGFGSGPGRGAGHLHPGAAARHPPPVPDGCRERAADRGSRHRRHRPLRPRPPSPRRRGRNPRPDEREPKRVVATSVETFGQVLTEGIAGDNVGVLLRGVKRDEVERGQVAIHGYVADPACERGTPQL